VAELFVSGTISLKKEGEIKEFEISRIGQAERQRKDFSAIASSGFGRGSEV
jgi:hypothetical protein